VGVTSRHMSDTSWMKSVDGTEIITASKDNSQEHNAKNKVAKGEKRFKQKKEKGF